MKIENVIIGNFVERPNRFLVFFKNRDNDNELEMAHLRDPGRLKELLTPDVQLLLRRAKENPNRKTKYDVIAVLHQDRWILINSGFHSDLAAELIELDTIPEIKNFTVKRREYTYGNSRIDFLLEGNENIKILLEVKGCTLVDNGLAKFPDAPTLRGRKHLDELSGAIDDGFKSAVLFLIIRDDASEFTPNSPMDPDFANALKNADKKGVKIIAYSFKNIQKDNYLDIKPFKRVNVNLNVFE
jgi:sugar fermentation stimulation protein A